MYNYVYSDELRHHGILGMKWGVRRFQNKDGTLTAQGEQRYSDGDTEKKLQNDTQKKTKKQTVRNTKRAKSFDDAVEAGRRQMELQQQQQLMAMQMQQMQQQQILQQELNRQHTELAIREAQRAASLSMSYGMNPFMFG